MLLCSVSLADDLSNNFTANSNGPAMDALAKDLGALMGAGSFHHGKALGFPIGFDFGVHVPVVSLKDENVVLKDDGSTAQALWGQAEVGLHGRINMIGRLGTFEDANMVGAGLRYGFFRPVLPGFPSASITVLWGEMDHDFFELETISINAVMSMDLPFVHPYLGGGYDMTTLNPKDSVNAASDGEAKGYRVEGGINVSVFPFTYFNLGVGLANGERLYHVGAGAKF